MVDLSLQFINQITDPQGQEGLVIFESARGGGGVTASVTSLGRWGTWVLAALLCGCGALMLRRSTEPERAEP